MNITTSFVRNALAAAVALLAGRLATAETAATGPDAAANAFFERALDERLELEPTTATSLGLKTGYDRWPDASEQGDAARSALAERQLAELRKFDPATLDDATRLSWQVFEANEERRIARYRWRNHNYLFDKDGAHASVPAFLINTHRIESDADAVAYVRRLEGIRPCSRRSSNVRGRGEAGHPRAEVRLPYVIEDAGNIVKGRPFDKGPDDSPLLADFRGKVGKLEIDAARREALIGDAERALLGSVKPASKTSSPGRAKPRRPRARTTACGSCPRAPPITTTC